LFGKAPLYTEKEVEFFGQKIKLQVFNKKRLLESIDVAPHGSVMFVSPRTFIIINHVDMPPTDVVDEPPQCDGDCETCDLFKGYEGEGDGC
jgi:hypothetical protein